MQYRPRLMARAVWLVCAHHLPVRRAAGVLSALLGASVSGGWVAALRGKAARLLESGFLPRVRELIASAPAAHTDETCARAAGALRYLHVACTEYLTAMHVGDCTKGSHRCGRGGPPSTACWSATATVATPTSTTAGCFALDQRPAVAVAAQRAPHVGGRAGAGPHRDDRVVVPGHAGCR
ncbi:IS66 family transposase [Actinacidiphila soli]|uniref:IS66 family transposase n=1 Tax=Actinacidiphila soli TaxID=2487275 RepID=UPI0038990D3A